MLIGRGILENFLVTLLFSLPWEKSSYLLIGKERKDEGFEMIDNKSASPRPEDKILLLLREAAIQ